MHRVDIQGAETLLRSLEGIAAARIEAGPDGRIEEIHVLASPGLMPKQVARNVDSALRAALDLEVDRRIISVAQTDAAEAPEPARGGAQRGSDANGGEAWAAELRAERSTSPMHETTPPSALFFPGRPRLLDFRASCQAGGPASCQVSLEWAGLRTEGEGRGPGTLEGRAAAAAHAAFAALERARPDARLEFDRAALFESRGRSFVLVAAYAFPARRPVPLTGVAPILRGPEEAAILAALQATNRWNEAPAVRP